MTFLSLLLLRPRLDTFFVTLRGRARRMGGCCAILDEDGKEDAVAGQRSEPQVEGSATWGVTATTDSTFVVPFPSDIFS